MTEPSLWRPPSESGLAYRLTLTQLGVRSAIDVEMVVRATEGNALANPYEFIIPSRWAGFDDHDLDLGEISTFGASGQELTAHRSPGSLIVDHNGESELRLHYGVRPRARQLTESSRFHAVGAPELFFAIGRNVIVRPRFMDPATTAVALELRTAEAESVWVTTLGVVGERAQTDSTPLRGLLDAALCAGRPRLLFDEQGSHDVVMATDPSLAQVEDRILEMARRIDRYQAMVYGELPWQRTVVIVMRRADDRSAMTGSGRPGGFVLELGDQATGDEVGLAELIAHESLHRYVGIWLRFAHEDAVETLWFKEGVVEYLAAQTVVRSGLGGPADFLRVLSRAVTGYFSNNCCAEPVADEGDEIWHDRSLLRQHYERGFLLAFWLDVQLRRSHDRLDGAVADLVEVYGDSDGVGAEELTRFLLARLDRDLHETFRRVAVGREHLPVAAWLEDAGLIARREREPAPYYGVNVTRDRAGWWRVDGVDPMGPAAGLSIRMGDRLMEMPDVPTSGQSQSARFVISSGGVQRVVSVPPVAGERTHWVVEDTGDFAALMGWAR